MFHLKQNDSFLTNRHKSMSEELINKSEEVAPENEVIPTQEMKEEVAPVAEEIIEATPEIAIPFVYDNLLPMADDFIFAEDDLVFFLIGFFEQQKLINQLLLCHIF